MPCTGALAAENYTLTIQDSNKDHKYTAYQVFAGTVQNVEGKEEKQLNVTGWGSGVDTSKAVSKKTLVQAIQEITVDTGNKPLEGRRPNRAILRLFSEIPRIITAPLQRHLRMLWLIM